jgi:hypothetical protein
LQKWQVIESAKFMIAKQQIDVHGHDWTDLLSPVFWTLTRGPERVGFPTVIKQIRTLAVETFPDMPDLLVYYQMDRSAGTVTLLSIVERESDDPFEIE